MTAAGFPADLGRRQASHQSRPDGNFSIPAMSTLLSRSDTLLPPMASSGAISANGASTKARSSMRGCEFEGCEIKHYAKGLCRMHYI